MDAVTTREKRSKQPKNQLGSLRIGQSFNPFGLFNGILIPEMLVRAIKISPGSKLAYGRLARYAGQDGDCLPLCRRLPQRLG